MSRNQVSLRERLEGLMLFRVVLVTIFLGSTVALDLSALSSFSDKRNLVLLGLIVGTYGLTIIYALLLRRGRNLQTLAFVQISGDIIVTTLLVMATGGLESIFIFMFHLNIINAAVVTGRRGALYVATATSLVFIGLAPIALGALPNPLGAPPQALRALKNVVFEVAVNSTASFLISVLAGYLAERLGEATVAIEQQLVDLEELRTLNRNILASLSSGLLTISSTGQIIFFNQAAELITGWPGHEVLGKDVGMIFPEIARIIGEADVVARGQSTIPNDSRFEHLYFRPDARSVFLGFSVSALRDSQGQDTGRIIIFQDLSEIRKLEQQVKRAERLAAVGELSAAIAHEIRNPLASISGSVEMLKSMSEVSEDDDTLMRIVIREVERLDKLITDFLAYCSPRPLTLSEVSMSMVVNDVLRLFKNRRGESAIELEFVDESDQLAVGLIDQEAFQQVLWNLLNNSADALLDDEATHGRRIRVELRQHRDAMARSAWMIAVEDDGPGIDPQHADRIFEPFFTTKQGGTGLGLATIYRLVEEHGGSILLEPPRSLHGARFEISLPSGINVESTAVTRV
ncbi:MAG: PAS domain S-box protein [Bradymonadaceae bacterium]|nr:PAS domain S-box protein [Lujinxingiaceae bacterium]